MAAPNRPRIPLFTMPDRVVLEVLSTMTLMEKFCFSLLSSRSRNFIRSVHSNLPARFETSVRATIANEILLTMKIENSDELTVSFITTLPISIARHRFNTLYRDRLRLWDNFGPTVELWIDHLLWIMNQPIMKRMTFTHLKWANEMKCVWQTFKRHHELAFMENCPRFHARMLLEVFPRSKKLIIPYNCFEERIDFYRMLAENFDSLQLATPLTLDAILGTNAVSLKVSRMEQFNFNRFIKLWLQNIVNPRLEHMVLTQRDVIDRDAMLRDISFQEVLEPITFNRARTRYEYDNGRNEITLTTGWTITRGDGEKATIRLGDEIDHLRFTHNFEFYVW